MSDGTGEDLPHHTAADGFDQFIPVSKSDLLDALVEQGAFANDDERDKFRLLCEMLAATAHFVNFKLLERLRDDYYYFSPELAQHSTFDAAAVERAYADLVRSLERVLRQANFVEIPHDDIGVAHRRRHGLRVTIKAPMHEFRDVRFWRRGRHTEHLTVNEWFGLRQRKVETEVYDDVVLMVAMKAPEEIGSRRELRRLERRKIVPGSVLLKCFRNIAVGDLNALFPNVRVVMSHKDKLTLGLPALVGGIPILLKIYATITVLFLVVAFYLGARASVEDKDLATALAALGGLVAFGGFAAQQWMRYQWKSLKYQTELSDNVYFRNTNNNSGIFDYLIGAVEDQECKEAFLAYHFLHTAPQPSTADELDGRIEHWLQKSFGVDIDFEVNDTLGKLERLGLLRRQQQRLFVSPLDGAVAQLQSAWAGFLSNDPKAAVK
jgi:hypothetical protein